MRIKLCTEFEYLVRALGSERLARHLLQLRRKSKENRERCAGLGSTISPKAFRRWEAGDIRQPRASVRDGS